MSLRTILVALLMCGSLSAQSLEETKAYILRELPQAQSELSRTVFDGFQTVGNGRLVFVMHADDPVDKVRRQWVIPIAEVDVWVMESRFGTNLMVKARKGEAPLCVWVNGADPKPIPFKPLISESKNPEKVAKLERAFKHLIELVSGRKELF